MKYYLKNAFIPFFYLMFTGLTSLSISMITNDLLWLKMILWVLNVGLYACVVFLTSFKDGQTAYGVLQSNDREREIIVKTGEYRELRLVEEYRPWKGFFHGFLATIPLIVLLIIHAIVIAGDPTNISVGRIAGFIYMTFYSFFSFGGATAYAFFYTLIAVPIMTLTAGIPYLLGARKASKNYAIATDLKNRIYGDNK